MRRFAISIVAASFVALVLPHVAAAQCEGGTSVAGFYARDGSYIPGHCAYTNPTTPGQLYPSGAQPMPSTDPAQGASRLPGQVYPSGPLPVNSTDLGPAPGYVSTDPLRGPGVAAYGPSLGPGAPVAAGTGVVPPASVAPPLTRLPDQFPQTGLPALNGNRAVPSALGAPIPVTGAGAPSVAPAAVPGTATTTTGVVAGTGTPAGTSLSLVNTAYGLSLGAAPARTEQTYVGEQSDSVTLAFPNQ
jgi:hypothetical protein